MNPTPQTTQPTVDPSQFGQYSDWAKSQMANGVSADTIGQTLKQNNLSTQSQGQGGGSNFFQSILPTIGGIVAPIAGAALAPETGGLSLLASAALSGLGGAAGQAVENATEGKSPIDQNVLSSGIENAVGGATGGLLGKLGGGLLKGVIAPAAEKGATSLLAGQGAGALTNEDAG